MPRACLIIRQSGVRLGRVIHDIPTWFRVGSLVLLGLILGADLFRIVHKPKVPTMRESAIWVGIYVGLALLYAGALLLLWGHDPGTEFLAGWLTEYSLSVDNLFVFMLILTKFSVPREYQQRVLLVGIIVALIFRAAFILAGAAILARFTWVFYLFGIFLIYTAIKLIRGGEDEEEYQENALMRQVSKFFPLTDHYDAGKIRTRVNGAVRFTPMLIVFLTIGTTDVLFAMDSIPAIFGLTRDPFIVFTANIFALMGLRQLFFLLGGLLEKLVYLPIALAAILGFIGIKLILEALAENTVPFINHGHHIEAIPAIPTWVSLAVIGVAIGGATAASLLRTKFAANHHHLTPHPH